MSKLRVDYLHDHPEYKVVQHEDMYHFNTDSADQYYADRQELHKQGRGPQLWRIIPHDCIDRLYVPRD